MKILASDYDGTFNRGGTVCKADIEAVEKWRTAGNLFGLVTGRGYQGAVHEMNYYGVKYDFLICNNGAVIFDANGNCLSEATGNNDVLKHLVEYIIKFNGERAAISCGKYRYCVVLDEKHVEEENWIDFKEIDNIEFGFTQVDTNAITDQNAAELAAEINQKLNGVYAHQNGTNVDITPIGVNKPQGIYSLMRKMKVEKNNVFVIGDNLNDLAMIKEFNGAAVKSGNPDVICKASGVYESVGEFIKAIF